MIIHGKDSGMIDMINKFILKEIILEKPLNYKCGDAPFTLGKSLYRFSRVKYNTKNIKEI
jgi:hypothetical protein